MSVPLPPLLQSIAERKRAEASELHCAAPALWAKAEGMGPARDFLAAVRGGRVIAEIKRRSPSGGELLPDLDPAQLSRSYAAAGAAAISVLTDAPDFGGSLADLGTVREACGCPVLRKDFVVDPIQVAEARIGGADAVLLIAAMLDDVALEACVEAATRCGVTPLIEVHSADEIARVVPLDPVCVGINNRDLSTLTSDLGTFAGLRPLIPAGIVCIAESAIGDAAAAVRMREAGADAVLIGEALLRAEDPGAMCAAMVEAMR